MPGMTDIAHLQRIIAAYGSDDPVAAVFQALDQALTNKPGHRLFTILVYHPQLAQSQRAWSSQPGIYPPGGRKALSQAPRMRQVLASGEPFIGHTREDIRENYPDHEKLFALGCESVVNMPVRWGGTVLGTVNLLHGAAHYREADLPLIRCLAQLAVPAFMAMQAA